jgi:pyruvate kinase
MMARIIESAETGKEQPPDRIESLAGKQSGRVSRALSEAAAFAASELGTTVTAVFTASGLMARRLSSLRDAQARSAVGIVADLGGRAAAHQ